MNWQELERLVRKYYGYVADLEGSGVEALDLLFVRDKIQDILDASGPEAQIPIPIFEQIHDLDQTLWAESETLCAVIGDRELQHARRQQHSPRSHWWWYLDGLKALSQSVPKPRSQHLPAFVPA
jgi:hypothetical protein